MNGNIEMWKVIYEDKWENNVNIQPTISSEKQKKAKIYSSPFNQNLY